MTEHKCAAYPYRGRMVCQSCANRTNAPFKWRDIEMVMADCKATCGACGGCLGGANHMLGLAPDWSKFHTYTFEDHSNSYFMGSDVHVERSDGRTCVINAKDGMAAVRVKDRDGSFLGALPEDVRELAEDLNRANKSRVGNWPYPDCEWTDVLYEQARESWWIDARILAQDADFDGVFSAGRSGGWCCIDGTNDDRDAQRIMHPEDEDDREFQSRFLELAFDLLDLMEHEREMWITNIRYQHRQLEFEREACLVRGEN